MSLIKVRIGFGKTRTGIPINSREIVEVHPNRRSKPGTSDWDILDAGKTVGTGVLGRRYLFVWMLLVIFGIRFGGIEHFSSTCVYRVSSIAGRLSLNASNSRGMGAQVDRCFTAKMKMASRRCWVGTQVSYHSQERSKYSIQRYSMSCLVPAVHSTLLVESLFLRLLSCQRYSH